jgi:hypothetical protein
VRHVADRDHVVGVGGEARPPLLDHAAQPRRTQGAHDLAAEVFRVRHGGAAQPDEDRGGPGGEELLQLPGQCAGVVRPPVPGDLQSGPPVPGAGHHQFAEAVQHGPPRPLMATAEHGRVRQGHPVPGAQPAHGLREDPVDGGGDGHSAQAVAHGTERAAAEHGRAELACRMLRLEEQSQAGQGQARGDGAAQRSHGTGGQDGVRAAGRLYQGVGHLLGRGPCHRHRAQQLAEPCGAGVQAAAAVGARDGVRIDRGRAEPHSGTGGQRLEQAVRDDRDLVPASRQPRAQPGVGRDVAARSRRHDHHAHGSQCGPAGRATRGVRRPVSGNRRCG